MKVIIKYYVHDGMGYPFSDELSYEVEVKSFSDYHDKFNMFVLSNYDDNKYVTIKSVKVIDIL
jgi:hypothetical protein